MGNILSRVPYDGDDRQPLVEGETLEDSINATRDMSTAEFDAYVINAAAKYKMPDLLPYVLLERTAEERRAMVQFFNTGTMDGPAVPEDAIEKNWPLVYDENKPGKSSEFSMKIGKALYSGSYEEKVADLFWMSYRCTFVGRNYVLESLANELPTVANIWAGLDVGSLFLGNEFPTMAYDKMRGVIETHFIGKNGRPDDLTPFGEVLLYIVNRHEDAINADRNYLMQLTKSRFLT